MKKFLKKFIASVTALTITFSTFCGFSTMKASAADDDNVTSIGEPTFKNTDELESVYNTGLGYTADNMLKSIYDSDVKNAKGLPTDYYMDRILERPGVATGDQGSNGNGDGDALLTRGRALYMFTHDPSVIGFGGDTAYCQKMSIGGIYSVTFDISGQAADITEDSAKRINCPSHWISEYKVGNDITVKVSKFISEQNVAVTLMDISNASSQNVTLNMKVTSNYMSDRSQVTVNGKQQNELIGSLSSPSNLTTLHPHMTGDDLKFVDGSYNSLQRDITVPAGKSVSQNVVASFETKEIPESQADYIRFAGMDNATALQTQKAEYNAYWYKNIPYISVPNLAIQKAIDYRWWSYRFNKLDANIPGYDYQYPVTIEGVLGYNNAISLTQPMHLQDVKWMRDPSLAYGILLSAGNSSQSSAFMDNPGNRSCWNRLMGQYIATAGLDAFDVIGGNKKLANTLAYYFEHNAKGQLDVYSPKDPKDPTTDLIEYANTALTGNDADTISFFYPKEGSWKNHAENAYIYGSANAAAKLYQMIGNNSKATELSSLSSEIQKEILDNLWCNKDQAFETRAVNSQQGFVSHNPDQPNLIPWKESNNFNYFSERVVPTDADSIAKYATMLRLFNSKSQFPIWPCYTANQTDNTEAIKEGAQPTNNFSNINFTLQARTYSAALHTYDRQHKYVTPEMMKLLLEWQAYNLYPDSGDVTYPNNNEFYNINGKTKDDYYRSWISHDTLGNYNYLFIEEMAGMRTASDSLIHLDPVDFGYDHFMVNNLNYHGKNVSIVWNQLSNGKRYYSNLPEGYSLYVDGKLVANIDKLTGMTYDASTGDVQLSDVSSGAKIISHAAADSAIPGTTAVNLSDKATRVEQELETSGIMQDSNGNTLQNLAEGANVTATYTAAAREAKWNGSNEGIGTRVNEMTPTPGAITDGVTVDMPFWGNDKSPNKSDSVTIDLKTPQKVDMMNLYFYDDRQPGGYTAPQKYTIEYWDGYSWHYMTDETRAPNAPQSNYNNIKFDSVTTSKVRVTVINQTSHYTAISEAQLYNEGGARPTVQNQAPEVSFQVDHSKDAGLKAALIGSVSDDGMPYDKSLTFTWSVEKKPSVDAEAGFSDPSSLTPDLIVSEKGDYVVRLTASDGEKQAYAEETVSISNSEASDIDVAVKAKPSSDYTASWEDISKVNDCSNNPTTSSPGPKHGWGNWGCPGGTGSKHYIEYDWDTPVNIYKTDIYWYDDGGGTRVPSDFSFQYKDENNSWKDVSLKTDISSAKKTNCYNTLEMDPIKTKALRLNVTMSAAGTGVLRWKTYSKPISVKEFSPVFVATKANVQPNLPKTVNAILSDGTVADLPVTWNVISASQLSSDCDFNVDGLNADTNSFAKAHVYVRTQMDEAEINQITDSSATITAGSIPTLPKVVKVEYNNGAIDNVNVGVTWDSIPLDNLLTVGTYTVNGAVAGTQKKADLTLKVTKASADKSALLKLYYAGKQLAKENYTDTSWKTFSDVMNQAYNILISSSAVQTQIDPMVMALSNAKNGLVENKTPPVTPDKTVLQKLYDSYKSITKGNYTDASWATFLNALKQAYSLLIGSNATQDQINSMVKALSDAKNGLQTISSSGSDRGSGSGSGNNSNTPVPSTGTFVSDTNSALVVNNAYTFKITSMDGKAPTFVVGTPGIFTVQFVKQSGNDYFYKIIAIGPVGAQAGIYVNGEKLLVATVKSETRTFVSDTNSNLSVNSAYTFKITSKNGKAPNFVIGTPGAFDVKLVKHVGNDYYIRITAVGAPGTQAGIYINGGSPFLVATVGSNPSYVKSDTTGSFQVRAGKSYVFKLTGNAKPSFVAGTGSAFKVSFVKQSGKDYFFRVTAVGKARQASGFYINHQARAAVATIS